MIIIMFVFFYSGNGGYMRAREGESLVELNGSQWLLISPVKVPLDSGHLTRKKVK